MYVQYDILLHMLKKTARFLVRALVVYIIFASGFALGNGETLSPSNIVKGLINTTSSESVAETDFMPFWRAWKLLEENYDGATSEETDDQKKVWGAIKGLAASYGDPHTMFFDPEETKSFNDVVSGRFGGVGMEVTSENGVAVVVTPLKNSPAAKAGILPRDIILKVDGEEVSGKTTEAVVRKIKGDVDTKVTLTIFRESEKDRGMFDITITRAIIESPVVETDMSATSDIFIIKINNFSETAPELFRKALLEFVRSGRSRLIIDLRNNPGGYLEAAVSMTSWFLPEGKVIVNEKSKSMEDKSLTSLGYNVFNPNFKFVILINEGSASASEIMAGALREHNKAILIGQKSYGKGSVQKPIALTPETIIKITIARWYTPNGVSIDKNGVTPDVEVKQVSKYDPFDTGYARDEQMQKAFEEVRKLDLSSK